MRQLWYLVLALVVVGCSSIDCPVQNIVSVQYEIYNADGTALSIGDSLTITSRRKDGRDTTLLNRGIGISSFSLPVSYAHPEDELVFTFTNKDTLIADTVWIKKEDIPHFESVDCSAAFFHELTGVRFTTYAIDSLVIKNRSVNYDTSTIHFYLYPKTGN